MGVWHRCYFVSVPELRAVVLFEVDPVVAGHGEAPVAERFLAVAVAGAAEDDGAAVLAAQGLGVGELLEGGVDDAVDPLGEAGEGRLDAARDDGSERIVADRFEDAGGDERGGVTVGDGELGAGFLAVLVFVELEEHRTQSRR
jgi:hypothetical protein